MNEPGIWHGLTTLNSRTYTCGHCGNYISSEKAYYSQVSSRSKGSIYICHGCNKPTYFTVDAVQTPGALLGGKVAHLPDDISRLYDEIRNATTTNSYTAAVLTSRKLLMHVAVDEGAAEGLNFISYVDYLVENGYTPPKARDWVNEIRSLGNEANHEIVIMNEANAKSIIKLLEMLLKFNYEFPSESPNSDGTDVQV